ncbi:zf-HC2 domain-containing protein [Kutzneria sp. CA-103260]|uniref:zf-HC2 domain-containing protein n=1 Tax=Kutzneria sp. CA-103260 TaxID=2802641 RepID=UPI001BAB022A|nr:zf-HC2 domain-containing protein [Kutzneria sp. CA-103260]QUQ65590.1 integral membrane protein [Kutzneria sp. CA-103260]
MNHASDQLIEGYASGAPIPDQQTWALEAHLEACGTCRARLAAVQPGQPLVDLAWAALLPSLDRPPARTRKLVRWLSTWVTPVMLPWLVMSVLVAFVAVFLDTVVRLDAIGVTGVQLVAPVLPVLGVAASWARGLDPAYEIVAASARAGLYLVFRRTAAVLAVVMPALLVAGWLTDTELVLWLLPSLAFTAGTLAFGGLVGVSRAAYGLIAVWVLALVLPTVAVGQRSFAFTANALPVWAVIFVLATVVVALRRGAFTRLGAHR